MKRFADEVKTAHQQIKTNESNGNKKNKKTSGKSKNT